MVNLAIAEAGFAEDMTIEPNNVYADLFQDAVTAAKADNRGVWVVESTAPAVSAEGSAPSKRASDGLPPGDIVIACTLFNPATQNDADAETVTLHLRETLDTRGYYLHDQGSGTKLRLPPGEHGPGTLVITNLGQGIWNNSGDTIFLEYAGETIDEWDYTHLRRGEGVEICRNDP
jgi:hypothetical protein